MVLRDDRGNPGFRLLLGVIVIALSIYVFYLGIARQNTPGLFLLPEKIEPAEYHCELMRSDTLVVCLPARMHHDFDGETLAFSSLTERVRGEIRLLPELAGEQQWRDSLQKPLIRTFLGEVDDLESHELMKAILERRYNPSLMGVKARVLPSWMRTDPQAVIYAPEGIEAFLFVTPHRQLGVLFTNDMVVTYELDGTLDPAVSAGILRSVTLP